MKKTHPLLGMEIEANWPRFSELPLELTTLLEEAAVKAKVSSGSSIYDHFMMFTGGRSKQLRSGSPSVLAMLSYVPEKFLFPLNWDKGHDSGVEGRYDSPASSLGEAIDWTTDYARWLRDFGFTRFTGAGTHIHLGHVEYLDDTFGKLKDNPLRARAEALMWAYFSTRETAIYAISAPHRRSCGSCDPFFTGHSVVNAGYLESAGDVFNLPHYNFQIGCNTSGRRSAKFDAKTPLWAFHNHLLSNWTTVGTSTPGGFYGNSVCNRRKSLPTLEFRFFSGTHATTALVGYLKLLHNMFRRATTVIIEENLRALTDSSLTNPVLVNPFAFTIDDLKKEIEDPWLLKWIDLTIANKGNPITDDVNIATPVACAA